MSRKALLFCILILLAFVYFADPLPDYEDEFEAPRLQMVKTQLVERGITDKKVLNAMLSVKRHLFVAPNIRDMAYSDSPLPIGDDQTISQPYIVALMTELLQLRGDEKVLEIGTGSGYQAAVLSELCKEVYTIEILKSLADTSGERLKDLGYKNVKVKCGDGWLGWPEYAQFDGIIVTCAPDVLPKALVEQLKDGGKMVVPVGEAPYQELKLIKKSRGKIESESIIPVLFVPMVKGSR